MNPLELLPVKVIKARIHSTKDYVNVLIDGDYDGEYLGGMKWTIGKARYVVSSDYGRDKKNRWKYLHQIVLPAKKGYWITHLNGNKLDNRSCNLAYKTPKEIIKIRDSKKERIGK